MVFGHVDEIPSRAVWHTIAGCTGPLPTNVAITNMHGHVLRVADTPFRAKGRPYTMGSPMVMRAAHFSAGLGHPHGGFNNVWLVGGVHLTNYCYAGSRVLKEWTATEARPDQMRRTHPSCELQVRGCRLAAINGNKLLTGVQTPSNRAQVRQIAISGVVA